MVINEPPDQLIEYVPKIKMLPLDIINNYFNANSYTYDPYHIHIIVSSIYLKELYYETKYESSKKNFRWHITRDMHNS